ncbi:hypothetical protein BDZ89DRAFT_736064 [Hymenopellis radicata]|nr:hypothetical protein BDZ89DRAFT_736064 [Hymenopellis radicata]
MIEITRSEIISKNDDVYSEEIKDDTFTSFKKIFPQFGEEALGEGHEFGWTGILGMTRDSVPFIGSVPGLAGQYVMAGFHGHGMARIFGCAQSYHRLPLHTGVSKSPQTGSTS